jgi:hypothetical protein
MINTAKLAGIVFVVIAGAFLLSQTNELFDFHDVSDTSVGRSFESVEEQTAVGGSSFDAADPNTIDGYLKSFVTVLVRPFPHEAGRFDQLVTAAEGLFLLGLIAASLRRLRAASRSLRTHPYIAAAVTFVILFVYAFAAIANFGILVRQRTQVLPFVFVPLALVAIAPSPRYRATRAATRVG